MPHVSARPKYLSAPPSAVTADASVSVNVRGVEHQLPLDEIRLIASCENYSEVVSADEHFLVRRTMQQWTRVLPAAQFVRVHRGLIVNLGGVGHVERRPAAPVRLHFLATASPPLEIKRRHWPALRRRLESWRLEHARTRSASGKSIAVLPFANFSRDAAGEIFCDGITEELINVLAQIPQLRVAARTSAFHFKNKNLPVAEVAQQLGVEFIIEGSVRRSGTHVRITIQLIEAASGFHLWSASFERQLPDIFAAQDEIAALVARQLQLKLHSSLRSAAAIDPTSHRLFLEGRHYWNLRTSDGFARADTALAKALDLEPAFAAAHAAVADLSVVRAMYRLADGAPGVADDLARVHTAARRALELDPTLGEPHAALGFACFHAGRFDEALAHFPDAFVANPNYATGYQFYAWTLAGLGRLEEALEEYSRAIALDPLNFINLDRHAAMLVLAGRYAEALESNERAAALRPDVFVGNLSQRAPILLALGRMDDAIAAARTIRRHGRAEAFRRNSDSDAIFVLRQTGHCDEAAAYAAEVLSSISPGNYLRGFLLTAVGRFEEAWPELVHTPSIMLPQLYWSPLWNEVRAAATFGALINRLGREAEYTRARG